MRRFTTALITLALSTSGLVFSPAQAASSFARKLSIVIAVALLGGVLAPVATATSASAATSSGFNYDLDGNNNATVTGCDGTCPANLVIPSTLDNNPVTVIGSYAFEARTEIISVTIPASVASIGNNAFDETELTSITFAEDSQLTSIGVGAFASATSLTSITIPASVTSIGLARFMPHPHLTMLTSWAMRQLLGLMLFSEFIPELRPISVPRPQILALNQHGRAWLLTELYL